MRRALQPAPLLAVAALVAVILGGVIWAASSATPTPAARTAPGGADATSTRNPAAQAAALVARMTLAQKVTELHGVVSSQHQRYVPGLPALGIPPLVITNGPAGVGPGDSLRQRPATALPAPIGLAASFDPALAYQYGRVIGDEAADLGANVVEAPDVNIVRVPEGGRTFESLSEDPYLTAATGTAETEGIQSRAGVIAEVKHFTAYSQETNRGRPADDNIVSTRVLHEIYLPPFQQALTRGQAGGLMCGYAIVNGHPSCQNASLLSVPLRRWGFTGLLQSDFGGARSTAASANAGLNLEMPAGDYYSAAGVERALHDGTLTVATIDKLLTSRFTAMYAHGLMGAAPARTSAIPAQADAGIALRAAEQGIVLLKNSRGVLPLKVAAITRIAVIGPYGGAAMTGGGGSSHVDPLLTVSPVAGLARLARPGTAVSYTTGRSLPAAVAAARRASVAVVMVGDTESEGHDQPGLALTGNQDQLVEAVARANPHTVVVVKSGNPLTMPWLAQVPAVLEAWYPGEEDGAAVAAVLFGVADPSGKLPVTFPVSAALTPVSHRSQFPGAGGKVEYSEGLNVGYRGYDAEGITPLFPFGFGLSYTTFRFSHLSVSQDAVPATVTATVTNTGRAAGAEVAQLYLGDPKVAGEPPRQLAGYRRVTLQPGQSAVVRFSLSRHDLSYWDDRANGWVVPSGAFTVYVGDSSAVAGLPLRGRLTVTSAAG